MNRLPLLLILFYITLGAYAQDAEWDVNAAHGPTRDLEFTTTEGTWLNVDVSPDGGTVIFDLLGDLYTIPLEGGKATQVTSGAAFDMQPRFSPDGSRIAFTSDRGGGDNIWIANADGSDPQQVTQESFRLLNGPAWTPDGQYILARKHFTSTRSLGAGEVWMYHTSGGSGLQLTKRKNDQQDQGNDIAVSPDGRYVFYSEDWSGGSRFQYNKDPNRQIYVVRRLDRETGEINNLITGPGGSARPQPSPDGKYIAFVRRVREKSVLYLYDRETGEQWPIFDGLNHDQQEAWAIFGVYPGFDWTPDSRHIVIWAGGHINRVDPENRDVVTIPFEVDVQRTITDAVRFPVEVSPGEFKVKMPRDAVTSPDGSVLVFNAVGYLWKKQLPDGKPERITTGSERFEYQPSFSPDGKSIVFTTWSDDEMGAVYWIDLNDRNLEKLTSRPGYYFNPRYSPDGDKIVFRRDSGNILLGFSHAVETGLYWMNATPTSGGESREVHFIHEEGRDARFGPDGRIYYLAGGGLDKEYKSVRIDGGDPRTHFDLKYVNSIVPSPDFKWVAFNELHNAYIAAFPKTGSPIELNRNSKAIPIKQVTRDAGLFLHWSGDGQKLHWMLGPEYFSRDLADSFAFLNDREDLPAIDTTGIPLGMTVATDSPAGAVAIVGGRIITMQGDKVIERGTIVYEGNRITAVGDAGDVTVPDDAYVVDASGQTVMPGLIDVHAHGPNSSLAPQSHWAYMANLAYGVTTTHNPSSGTVQIFSASELVKAGEIVGPRVFSTGTILYGADGDFKAVIDSLEDARSHLRRMKAVGAFSVKSYNQPGRNQRQQVLKAARELKMMVVPEGGSTFYHNVNMIIDGHTGIEHNVPVAPLYDDVLSVWAENPVGYTPTFVVSYAGPSGENYWYQNADVWDKDRLLTFVPRRIVDPRSRRRTMLPAEEYHYIEQSRSAKALVDRGGKVQMGAHGQLQGLAAHWELWMFSQGGMTNLQVLRSGTLSGAEYLGMDGDLGSLEPGKLADIIVIDGNPLQNIRDTEKVRYTVINGRIFDASTMSQLGHYPNQRRAFFWERDQVDDRWVWH